jgi:hypothetical protein
MYQHLQRSREDSGNAESPPKAKADNPFCHSQSPCGGSDDGETEQLLNGRSLPREDEYPAETGNGQDCLPSAKNRSREGTLCRDSVNEGDIEGDERELADAEPSVQLSDSQDRINSRHDIDRRRYYDTNDEEDYRPIEDSDIEHGRVDDII